MPAGSRKWPESAWRLLLREILQIEEHLPERLPFSFGGGTALAVHLDHRVSYDIDLFYRSADVFDYYNPNKNLAVMALVQKYGGSWQYPGNYLRLELGAGEIDVLISKFMTQLPITEWAFETWQIKLETPAEILAKKIRFRSSQFKRRDIFDMAAIARLREADLIVALEANIENLARLRDRIETMRSDYEEFIMADVNPTPAGRDLVQRAPEKCIAAIDRFLLEPDKNTET